MFSDELHTLFTLFAFILIKALCYVDTFSTTPKVDLSRFNTTVHCKFQPNGFVCSSRRKSRKYYFDIQLKRCVHFEYGYCNHSYNMFDGRHQCLDACRDDAYEPIPEILSEVVYCRYQPDFGDCNSYLPSWYYDVTDMTCKGFSYSGCGGNRNIFPTANECRDICGTAIAFQN